jgi:23S rRNA (pseudouridine1915-N3)-methyltransferase
MHITLRCIGKIDKSSPEQQLIDRYKTRISWPITILEYEVKKNLPEDKKKEAEGLLLLQDLPKNNKTIVLDERGKSPSTTELAKLSSKWNEQGVNKFTFLIGGAAGHSPLVQEAADYTLSFGPMTWPHMLVRAMLIEQLYRLHTLSSGHPYHK